MEMFLGVLMFFLQVMLIALMGFGVVFIALLLSTHG